MCEVYRQWLACSIPIDPFHVMRTLSVTITSSILSPTFVSRIFRHSTVGIHFDKIKSAIETTIKITVVDCESK